MKYIPPYGTTDPNGSWVNGDPTIGRQGSIPPAEAFEHPLRELHALIEKGGRVPVDTDLTQVAESVRSQRLNYAEDTGTENNLIAAYDPPIVDYQRGLTLRVKVRETNSGPCRINAGAGNVPIRKMNGADVGSGELPAGSIATLVHDGTVFQLSNFGGGGGTSTGDVFMVNIPYTVDLSTTPGTIIADFSPPIEALPVAGDIIAVKVANTTLGPTSMIINGLPPINLLPNGGGFLLQGDIVANDVVQFFFDGSDLRFPPNPEITAPVTYTIGPGQNFDTFDLAMTGIRRKMIGANGFVTLQFISGMFQGPIDISHPSADRLAVIGTMLAAPPVVTDFQRTGSSSGARANDAAANIIMLRQRYGTEIRIPTRPPGLPYEAGQTWHGIANVGPGSPLIADLLIVGAQAPNTDPTGWDYNGVEVGFGSQLDARNVTVWGSQHGFCNFGSLWANWCFSCANTLHGFLTNGAAGWYKRCGSFGNTWGGFNTGFARVWADHATAEMNGTTGWASNTGSPMQMYWCRSSGSGSYGVISSGGSFIQIVTPSQYGTTSPPINQVGNSNSMIVPANVADPGPPIGSPMPPQSLPFQARETPRQLGFSCGPMPMPDLD